MNATLLFDTYSKKPFGGSCGIVTYYFQKAFQQLGYKTSDVYVPVSDKTSSIQLKRPKNPTDQDISFFFEELFPRCEQNEEFERTKNISFFNLAYFSKLKETCAADVALFNSKYLMECFLTEVYAQNLTPPQVDWTGLPPGLLDFPNGYSCGGFSLSKRSVNELRKDYFVGHAIRPSKQDHFATLAILFHLNELAKKKSLKPFCLLISERDYELYEKKNQEMNLPKENLDFLHSIPQLDNKSITMIMKNSDFGLCYDTALEAFGYYLIESIFCGSPIFSNGQANIRHILPKNHGIYIHESLEMYFGTSAQKIEAYLAVAERIIAIIQKPKKIMDDCNRGKKFIQQHYSLKSLIKRLTPHLKSNRNSKKIHGSCMKLSPYLRLADWGNGRFVTDRGALQLPLESYRKIYQKLGQKLDSKEVEVIRQHKLLFSLT